MNNNKHMNHNKTVVPNKIEEKKNIKKLIPYSLQATLVFLLSLFLAKPISNILDGINSMVNDTLNASDLKMFLLYGICLILSSICCMNYLSKLDAKDKSVNFALGVLLFALTFFYINNKDELFDIVSYIFIVVLFSYFTVNFFLALFLLIKDSSEKLYTWIKHEGELTKADLIKTKFAIISAVFISILAIPYSLAKTLEVISNISWFK
ncbi:hypothetical protein ROU88_00915 [Macrococcus capreoli]|uniref:hypothetical protein n=1 Tax=Macrococcus capreoli TaxID=2982690 RepID=UPI0021D5BB7E|nr:hypothetical protein [Macrococcus sp. TMW 2.2395]MCU7556678.1 hypothetical protein [Macrococcus sp. TMW 2.2395]